VNIPELTQWEPVMVEWVDANGGAGSGGWFKIKKQDRRVDGCVTVGAVESQDDSRITLVLTRDTTSKVIHGMMTIPLVAITKFVRLDHKKEKNA
jgi:hypothetical protein